MSANNPPDPVYLLGHSDLATRRLIVQDQLYRPSTRRLFVAAGISPGMKVLEVGSGAGDVALLTADLVGPSGSVIGVERDAGSLELARARAQAAGWSNVSFVEGDVRTAALANDFDAVVGRWVLMWVAEPATVLRGLASMLRPGGVVAFQDNDFSFAVKSFPELPLFQQIFQYMTPQVHPEAIRSGPEFQMGLKLYQTYLNADLPGPQLLFDAPIGGGPSWTGYEYIALTLRNLLPQLKQLGVAPTEAFDLDLVEEQLRDESVANNAVMTLPAVIGAWARKQQTG